MEDLKSFQEFFDYKPCNEEDPTDILENILRKARKYLKPEEIDEIVRTYEFTREAHKWVYRKSWEPYIIHPLRATEFLMEINPDVVSIQSCILHDVIEDTDYTYEDIEKLFWKEIADICEWLVKVSKVRYKWEERDLETIKKTFLAMAKDLRVIFVKFADRIHNIQTLQYHPEEAKRIKIATETLKIYAPLAKRLWLYNYQLYLENWSFRVLYPDKFEEIMWYLTKQFQDGSKFLNKWIKNLTEILKKEWIEDFKVLWRIKSPFRIFEKMDKKYHTEDVSRIMDLLAFRVVTETVTDCYMILWIIHKYYTPLIKKIKDYIAIPKFNWYKSIHTTILWMFRFPVEIQIRTKKMDEVAEFWVAAHFAYAESNASVVASSQQWQWIQRLQQIVSDYQLSDDKEKFKDSLNIEILDKTIFVYTPKWDIKELPAWSSVLDFAFSVHSDIWLRFKNAIVNGQIRPLSYIVRTWDIIKINTFKNRYSAVKHWIDYLHTPSARGQLIKYVRTQEREARLDEAIDGLNQYLKNLWLPLFRSDADLIQKLWEPLEVERRLLQVLDKQETYWSLVRAAYPDLQREMQWKTLITDASALQKDLKSEITSAISWDVKSSDVIVDNDKLLHCVFCPECKPSIWDKIIAKSGREWIKIHTLKCKALKTLSYSSLLEAHRKESEKPTNYTLHIKLKFSQKTMSIIDIIALFSTFSIPIFKFELEKLDWKMTMATIEWDISNPAKIWFLLAGIRQNYSWIEIISKELK